MNKTAPIIAKKSYTDGHIRIAIQLRCSGYKSDNAKISGSTDLTCEEARMLARELIALADKADEKIAAKAKHEENRKKYRDREIASGRMIVFKSL